MRYLLTGGEGFVGRHVANALISHGHDVVLATRRDVPDENRPYELLHLDISRSDQDIYNIAGKPDVVIDMAWEDGFNHGSDKHLKNANDHIVFIENLLKGGLKHLVGLGTSHEIGFHVGAVMESTPTFPMHNYGVAKDHLRRVQQLLCMKYGAVNQWLRCFYITGEDHLNNSIFTKILSAASEGKAFFPLNSGELLFDFIDVRELGAMIASISTQTAVSGIINCCSGEPTSLKTMVSRFVEENNLPIELRFGEFPLRPYDSRAIWGDVSKRDLALAAALKPAGTP